MIRFAICAFTLLLAGPLAAQTVRVQTGEHDSFSRVVLTIPRGAEWTAEWTDAGYLIAVDQASGFNLSGFFDLIPRDRILDARINDDGALLLTMNCRCEPEVFQDTDRVVVFDFGDPLPDAPPPTVVATATAPPPVERVLSPLDLSLITNVPTVQPVLPRATVPAPEVFAQEAEDRTRLTELQASVAESLARAASQGLMELAIDPIDTSVEMTAPQIDDPTEVVASVIDPPPQADRPGIIAHTSVDQGLADLFDGILQTPSDQDCWPDALVDVATWGDDTSFSDQMAAHRGAITGEFDKIDGTAVVKLARLYIYFGFGREAVQTLNIDGNNARDRVAISALAQIVDGDPITGNALLAQTSCPSLSAFWAILAVAPTEPIEGVDDNMLAREFKRLPTALQIHLGPRFADALVALGRADTAEFILEPGLRNDVVPIETALAVSNIAKERGDYDIATDVLADVAQTEVRATPEAIIELIDLQISQDSPIDAETVAQAETLLFEYDEAEIAPELARVIIDAQLQRSDLTNAWSTFGEFQNIMNETVTNQLRDKVVNSIAASADDVFFLDVAFGDEVIQAGPATTNTAATRLLDLGFPERATDLLRNPAIGSVMQERRYLRAQAAVAAGEFEIAAAHLAGVTTDRAQGILSFGPDGVPLATLATAPTDILPTETLDAWRNGAWSELALSEDDLMRDVSNLLLEDVVADAETQTPLADGRELITAASETRATIDALINRFEAPLLADGP